MPDWKQCHKQHNKNEKEVQICPVWPFTSRNGCCAHSAYLHILVAVHHNLCIILHHRASHSAKWLQNGLRRRRWFLLHVHGSTSDEIHVYYHWLSFLTAAEDDPQTFYQSCTIVPKLSLLLLVPREFVCSQILRRGCFSWKRVGSGSRRLKAFRVKRRGEDGGAVSQSP